MCARKHASVSSYRNSYDIATRYQRDVLPLRKAISMS